jgi:hypothetical protein
VTDAPPPAKPPPPSAPAPDAAAREARLAAALRANLRRRKQTPTGKDPSPD